MKYSTYCYNRSGEPSPFEKRFKLKPRLDHIRPFGSIGFMLVPPELRKFKFEPVRRKGRLLGFANDDEPEILKGLHNVGWRHIRNQIYQRCNIQ